MTRGGVPAALLRASITNNLKKTIITMIELYLTKNNNISSKTYGKYYARVDYKQTYSIDQLAEHMAAHNTPFSKGTIAGILRDAAFCIRELTLEGNTVKIDNLAIFKASVEGNAIGALYDKDNDKTIQASIGEVKKNALTGPAVHSMKLLAQATGEYTKQMLNQDAILGWNTKTREQIAQAKADALDDDDDNG